MIIKDIKDEDFSNYKLPAMFILFPRCTFKCEKESGVKMCQNSELVKRPDIDILPENIVKRYLGNPLTSSIVFGGLEPWESYEDMVHLIEEFRKWTDDTIVIYTGYKEDEIDYSPLQKWNNIIIKFGRYIPNNEKHFDEVLGVYLASSNQYAKKVS